ncbi:MAG TPA: hypothetical protein VNP96_06680 [Solirubrobacterales bacterium]|nr:hypothetical protein [Solirubrobacterales bacterium]
MDAEIIIAVLGLVGTVGGSIGSYLGARRKYKAEIERLEHERDEERERQLERAQVGYRKLYEKFMKHFEEAENADDGRARLHDDYVEIQVVGFKPVCTALDEFWPEDHRIAGELPLREKRAPLLQAMRLHGSIRLKDLDAMRGRGEA